VRADREDVDVRFSAAIFGRSWAGKVHKLLKTAQRNQKIGLGNGKRSYTVKTCPASTA
jgi:hypothetical protein